MNNYNVGAPLSSYWHINWVCRWGQPGSNRSGVFWWDDGDVLSHTSISVSAWNGHGSAVWPPITAQFHMIPYCAAISNISVSYNTKSFNQLTCPIQWSSSVAAFKAAGMKSGRGRKPSSKSWNVFFYSNLKDATTYKRDYVHTPKNKIQKRSWLRIKLNIILGAFSVFILKVDEYTECRMQLKFNLCGIFKKLPRWRNRRIKGS